MWWDRNWKSFLGCCLHHTNIWKFCLYQCAVVFWSKLSFWRLKDFWPVCFCSWFRQIKAAGGKTYFRWTKQKLNTVNPLFGPVLLHQTLLYKLLWCTWSRFMLVLWPQVLPWYRAIHPSCLRTGSRHILMHWERKISQCAELLWWSSQTTISSWINKASWHEPQPLTNLRVTLQHPTSSFFKSHQLLLSNTCVKCWKHAVHVSTDGDIINTIWDRGSGCISFLFVSLKSPIVSDSCWTEVKEQIVSESRSVQVTNKRTKT